jgi:hypothetical protein
MEEVQLLPGLPGPIVAIDVDQHGSWVAAVRVGRWVRLVTNGVTAEGRFDVRFPTVRIDEGGVWLLGDRPHGEADDIRFHSQEEEERSFGIGYSIEEIVVLQSGLLVTYYDTAFGSAFDGVVLFDRSGDPIWRARDARVDVFACYCACAAGEDRALFLPYPSFKATLFDARTRSVRTWDTPEEVHGSKAVTVAGGVAFFHRPYGDDGGIWRWPFGAKSAERVAFHRGYLRGLAGGRLLGTQDDGYRMIDLRGAVRSDAH